MKLPIGNSRDDPQFFEPPIEATAKGTAVADASLSGTFTFIEELFNSPAEVRSEAFVESLAVPPRTFTFIEMLPDALARDEPAAPINSLSRPHKASTSIEIRPAALAGNEFAASKNSLPAAVKKKFYCTVPSCKKGGISFTRRDYRSHLRGQHRYTFAEAEVAVPLTEEEKLRDSKSELRCMVPLCPRKTKFAKREDLRDHLRSHKMLLADIMTAVPLNALEEKNRAKKRANVEKEGAHDGGHRNGQRPVKQARVERAQLT